MFKRLRDSSLVWGFVIVVVTAGLAVAHWQFRVSELVEREEARNVALAQVMADFVWPRFSDHLSSAGGLGIEALRDHSETRRLDGAVRELAAGRPVIKVRIFDREGRVVFSSEAAEIGSDASGDAGFQAVANGGRAVSEQVFRETFYAFEGKVREHELVESYVPVRWGPEQTPGVFELYSNVTAYLVWLKRTTSILAALFLLGFAALHAVLSRRRRR